MALEAGTKLAHYEILEPIGKGGMGEMSSPTTSLKTPSGGEYLYCMWAEDLGDIWVMDVVQE